ncbi:MAG TPA: hypothetical protein VN829_09365 [Dongiaceae bacterium]|nr:hypothetical protein [Dongiaceae bacterium]
MRLIKIPHIFSNTMAGISVASASVSFLDSLEQWMRIMALAVAITSGLIAIWHQSKRIQEKKDKEYELKRLGK